jgi:hypothetical protein
VKALLGGWTLSGIATFESGTPISINAPNDNLGLGGGTTNRADIVGPVSYPKTRFQWFSTSSFAAPGPLEWGTSGRNIIVGPGRNNWNMSLFKAFQFTERARFEFRAETFNTFNHTQFQNPGNNTWTVGSGNYGLLTSANDPRVLQLGAKLLF